MSSDRAQASSLAGIYREHGPRVLAWLVRRLGGDVERAEDALHSAIEQAIRQWAEAGMPASPAGWLATAAWRRAIDGIRKDSKQVPLDEELLPDPAHDSADSGIPGPGGIPDDRLGLIFMLCHPALDPAVRVPLILQHIMGFTAIEIGRAFLRAPPTVGQQLVRAKRKIRAAGIPLRVPDAAELTDRLPPVLEAIYLVFSEGYSATRGEEATRDSLCEQAIDLAWLVEHLLDRERLTDGLPEARGLLALMLLHNARRPARTDAAGAVVTLEEQDRSLWDTKAIAAATALLDRAVAARRPGPYQVEAAIAALHANAASYAETDWELVLLLYNRLLGFKPSPVVVLNRAVALARVRGPEAALASLEVVRRDPALARFGPLPLVLGDLYEQCGQQALAAEHYRRAAELLGNAAERRSVEARLQRLAAAGPGAS